ncbi:MAG: lipoyl synthase [Candidatus Helarchaeota archaeon]
MRPRKPEWITTSIDLPSFERLISLIREYKLHVVCFEASCPNIGACFRRKTATFLILGDICTRSCTFCGIKHGKSAAPENDEPNQVAKLVNELDLDHVVITSVTRDDLPDQGVSQFIKTMREIRRTNPEVIIELLVPDFQGDRELLNQLIREPPHILNHNIESVPRLYKRVRPQAIYSRSLALLEYVKEQNPSIYTKSGFMVGLGETEQEILELMNDLRKVNCDILIIGQYLQPTEKQLPVEKYYTPEEFKKYEMYGNKLGFLSVTAGPLIRSSYNAEEFSRKFLKDGIFFKEK